MIFTLLVLLSKLSAQTAAVEVDVYDYVGLKPATLQRFVNDTQYILRTTHMSVNVKLCERTQAISCTSQTEAKTLIVRVVAGELKKNNNLRYAPLGQSFADHNGGVYASVFLERVQDQASDANVSWVTVFSYAAVHEIGHLLLGDQAHTPCGVMKAHWNRTDYQAMDQNHFHFTDEQIRELKRRFGTTNQNGITATDLVDFQQKVAPSKKPALRSKGENTCCE